MDKPSAPLTILMADDDDDDCLLTRAAFQRAQIANELRFVHNGEELLDYLHRRGAFADPQSSPRPALILLDLNMPRKDGREALRDIKASPALRRIPVVVLTTSSAAEDVNNTYDLGANSFVTKPTSFEGLVEAVRLIGRYWSEVVALPSEP